VAQVTYDILAIVGIFDLSLRKIERPRGAIDRQHGAPTTGGSRQAGLGVSCLYCLYQPGPVREGPYGPELVWEGTDWAI
jgi:hypothetical protein